ncbi:sodium:alanine symporter, partial [Psychromonas sp. B3M02]|uniref:alanine:cation symporter family protein n=1 Tax=Psychromonas sp. B3M02 TaxID=2267226 RepID=UPI000E04FBB9
LAVDKVLPGIGKPFIALALFFFSFTTILAYYYIAETNVAYLRRTLKLPDFTFLLKIVLIAAAFYGTVKTANLAWGLGDVGVGLMAWLNIVGILLIFFMGKPAIKALKDYEQQRKTKPESYSFDPVKLGIKKATFWENRLEKEKAKK